MNTLSTQSLYNLHIHTTSSQCLHTTSSQTLPPHPLHEHPLHTHSSQTASPHSAAATILNCNLSSNTRQILSSLTAEWQSADNIYITISKNFVVSSQNTSWFKYFFLYTEGSRQGEEIMLE